MEILRKTLLFSHVFAGLLGLLVMALPLLARKGARLHRRSGWVFLSSMVLAGLSGIGLSLLIGALGAVEASQAALLVLVGLITLDSVVQAATSLRRKRDRGARQRPLELTAAGLLAAGSLGSLGLALSARAPVLGFFAVGGLVAAVSSARFSLRALATSHAHVLQHINASGAACISAVTAFLVLGGRRIFDFAVLGDSAWMLWILPSVLLGPVFRLWNVWYKRKLEGPRQSTLGLPDATR